MRGIFLNLETLRIGDVHRASAYLDVNHEILAAHFPGFPILPGVIILGFFREVASQHLGLNLQLAEAGNVKFIKPIIPKPELQMEAEFFILEKDDIVSVSGQLSYNGELIAKVDDLKYRRVG